MSSERVDFRSDIEGLRGLAILLVVAFHAGVSWLAGGYVGVDVFFVLSGYFITALLAREVTATGDVDLPEFYARRVRRLLPSFFVVLLATVALALWIYPPIDQPAIASDARAVALQYGNVLFADNAVNYHAASENPFLHMWSLAVEQQFYVLWPLLFALIGRLYGSGGVTPRRLIAWVTAAGVLSFVVSLWVTRFAQPWAFFGMPTRIWEFALGGVAALALTHQATEVGKGGLYYQLAGLIAIAVASVSYHQATAYPGIAAIAPALGTVALLIGGHRAPASIVSRALDARLLRWFGRISYTWYLWHWPIVGVGAVIDWDIGVGGRLVWSGFALILAVLTHRFIEKPWREGNRVQRSPQLVTGVALGASVVAALLAHGAMVMAERRASSPVQRQFAAARDDGMAHDCWGSLLENATAPCIFGDTTSRTSVVLMGDSHAEHWLPAIDRIGRERHWKIVAMVKPACPVADMADLVNARLKRAYAECTQWRRMMLRRIVSLHPATVILSSWDHYMPPDGNGSQWHVTPASWRDGLRRTYGLLSSAGINTVVIRGTPRPGFDVPACLSRAASSAPFKMKRCEYDRAESLHPVAIAAQNDAARGLDHIAFVDVNDRLCSSAQCEVVRRGNIVFRDDGHLTATFSLAEAPALASRIDAAMDRMRRR